MRRLIPWALVTVLALCAVLTVAFTEARKTPATPATLKAAQLSPSDLGNGWKVLELRAATAPATGGLLACPGSPTIAGPYSRAWFYKKNVRYEPSSVDVTIMQPSVGAQVVFDLLVRCILAKFVPGHLVPFHRTSAFDGLAQASTGATESERDQTHSVIGWFVQGDDLVVVSYLGTAPLSQVRQWAADAVAKAAANT